MITTNFDYDSCVRTSERVSWKLDEVFPPDLKLDFSRRFLPDSIAAMGGLDFLSDGEKLALNQITGNAYLYLFYFVEEYIIASVLHHAQAEMFGDPAALRALLRFADEEVKHQLLFQRFCAAFNRDFGVDCGVLESPQAVAELILGKSPMAVLLMTLHIELMTQDHFVESFRGREGVLDPFFASLLKHHWLEEAQHAKIDALELGKLAALATPAQIEAAVEDYVAILEAFSGLLTQQAAYDVDALEQKTGRGFSALERTAIEAAQTRTYRRTFILLGVNNAAFRGYLEQFCEGAGPRIAARIGGIS